MRVPDRAPPLHGDANLWRMQIHLKIRDAIENVSRTLDGSGVNPVLDSERFERGTLHDGLAHDGMRPRHRVALRVQTRHEAVMPHGPVPAALQVVVARPHDLHGSLGGLRHVDGFHHEVGRGICAPAESSPEQRRVNSHFLRW